jgi:hypothetical protein
MTVVASLVEEAQGLLVTGRLVVGNKRREGLGGTEKVRGIKSQEVGDETRMIRRTGETLSRPKPLQGQTGLSRGEMNKKRFRKKVRRGKGKGRGGGG